MISDEHHPTKRDVEEEPASLADCETETFEIADPTVDMLDAAIREASRQ